MFCSICREGKLKTTTGSKKTNAFIAGTDNIKLETVKLHEGTRQQKNASKDKKNRNMPVLKSPAGKGWTSLNKAKQVRVKRCMLNTHAIMRHAKPFTDYVWNKLLFFYFISSWPVIFSFG